MRRIPLLLALWATTAQATQAIAWREGDVAEAFTEARQTHKPVLLYWGAKWCPPCNRLKATLFQDPAFIAETARFIPVHLDGDAKSAQSWGQRFGIMGYPTIIILAPDGSEITRLSTGIDPNTLPQTLRIAAGRTTDAQSLLARAEGNPKSLTAADYALLAGFDWQDDPRHLSDPARRKTILSTLASNAPTPALSRRFALLALTTGLPTTPGARITLGREDQDSAAKVLPAILASPAETKTSEQDLSQFGAALIDTLPDGGERAELRSALTRAGDALYADASLPLEDRLLAIQPELDFATATPDAKVPAALLAKVQARVAWADHAAQSPVERQSVIEDASALLEQAGDDAGAEALLKAELTRSAMPFFYMTDLSDLAEKQHDPKAALDWARKAAEQAQGPASRVQWASIYAIDVLRLAPTDTATIEASADALTDRLAQVPDGFHERTAKRVTRWAKAFSDWGRFHAGDAALVARVTARLNAVCARQSDAPTRAACVSSLTQS